jgi:flagellar biosynthesis protein FliR
VIPTTYSDLEHQLLVWLFSAIRPGAAFLAAPVFGAPGVPVQCRLVIAFAIGVSAFSLSPEMAQSDSLISLAGLLSVVSELLLGLSMGFAIQIGMSSAVLGGEAISNAMGLGFAAMNDPLGGQSSPAIGQFLSMLSTALFLSIGGHLILAGIIVESFTALPPGQAWLSFNALHGLAKFGGLMFAAGLSVAFPVGVATLLVQMTMAFVARATPSLNLFAVGVPATLMAGLLLLGLSTPIMSDRLTAAITAALGQARSLGSSRG